MVDSAETAISGNQFSEIIFFGILIYLAALFIIAICTRTWMYKLLCPLSGFCVHTTFENEESSRKCPDCRLLQWSNSSMCCKRNHSVYAEKPSKYSKIKAKCFAPDFSYCKCICCEFSFKKDEISESQTIVTIITDAEDVSVSVPVQ